MISGRGYWDYGNRAGIFSCSLNYLPLSSSLTHLGAYLSVLCDYGNWGYRRNVGVSSCYILSNPTKPIDSYGAYISGDWWHRELTGAFCCFLHLHSSWSASFDGASIVVQDGDGMLVLPCHAERMLIHGVRLLPLGRTGGYWWYRRAAGIFFCHLNDHPMVSEFACGAKENRGELILPSHIIFILRILRVF